jgi:hypothetical protein
VLRCSSSTYCISHKRLHLCEYQRNNSPSVLSGLNSMKSFQYWWLLCPDQPLHCPVATFALHLQSPAYFLLMEHFLNARSGRSVAISGLVLTCCIVHQNRFCLCNGESGHCSMQEVWLPCSVVVVHNYYILTFPLASSPSNSLVC